MRENQPISYNTESMYLVYLYLVTLIRKYYEHCTTSIVGTFVTMLRVFLRYSTEVDNVKEFKIDKKYSKLKQYATKLDWYRETLSILVENR